jgi:hypothetical protein
MPLQEVLEAADRSRGVPRPGRVRRVLREHRKEDLREEKETLPGLIRRRRPPRFPKRPEAAAVPRLQRRQKIALESPPSSAAHRSDLGQRPARLPLRLKDRKRLRHPAELKEVGDSVERINRHPN